MLVRHLKPLVILFLGLWLAACAGTGQAVRHGAEEAARSTLAAYFARRFGEVIQSVVATLAEEGGYLDNPLVRILLPPPAGLVIDVARDLHADPRAAVLEVLMNRAAEHAVPHAGPILMAVLRDIERPDWQHALTGGREAATEMLRGRAESAVREAMRPALEARLLADGAVDLYRNLLDDQEVEARLAALDPQLLAETPLVQPEALVDYVTDRAVDGLFKSLARNEGALRNQMPPLRPAPQAGDAPTEDSPGSAPSGGNPGP